MIELLANQPQADRAYRRWVDALIAGSTPDNKGWVIDGTGVLFSNYGHGEPGTIEDQVMLGVDSSAGNGIVKIVRPVTAEQDRHKLTVAGRDENGSISLLREGWLKKNRLSTAVRERFSALSGLSPVPLSVAGRPSNRYWYVVANTDDAPDDIVAQTVAFTNACSLARWRAGGRLTAETEEADTFRLGMDEKGRVKKVKIKGGAREVEELQGYVSEALKTLIGSPMTKPTLNGYAVDAMISEANLLIEIKTGTSAHDIYEAVGQLALYPSLISLPGGLNPILLIPTAPALRPHLAAALAKASIEVHCYSVGRVGKKPAIEFTPAFLYRCRAL